MRFEFLILLVAAILISVLVAILILTAAPEVTPTLENESVSFQNSTNNLTTAIMNNTPSDICLNLSGKEHCASNISIPIEIRWRNI